MGKATTEKPMHVPAVAPAMPSPAPPSSRAPASAALLLLVALAVAGCLAGPGGSAVDSAGDGASGDADGTDFPYRIPPDVDWTAVVEDPHPVPYGHVVPDFHTTHHGLELVGHSPLTENMPPGMVPGGYGEVQICGDHAVVASFASNRGATIVDLSDPTAPTAISHVFGNAVTWDVRWADDCGHLVLGYELGQTERVPVPGGPGTTLGASDATARGIAVYDVSDPTAPVFESYVETPGVHNLYARTMGNQTVVVNSPGEIFLLEGEEGSHMLRKVAQVDGSHDVHIEKHPVLGTWMLYTGFNGLSVYDLTDPAEPELLGQVTGEGGAWHEQTPIPELIDGRALVVGGGEDGLGDPLPTWVLDVTDPANITAVGRWDPKHTADTPGFFHLTLHNMAYHDGMVSIAQYHAGIWLVDLTTPDRIAEPVTLGAYQPHGFDPVDGNPPVVPYAPWVWGSDWTEDGYLVVPDMNTGLYVLEVDVEVAEGPA